MIKKIIYSLFFVSSVFMQISCNGGKVDELQARIDSLTTANEQKDVDYQDLSSFVETISTSIDSIASSENMILYSGGREGAQATKEEIKSNLDNFADLLQRQRAQIADLEKRVSENSASRNKMKKIIQYMTAQLEEKEKEIKNLRAELESKNVDIANLNKRVTALHESNTELSNTIKEKDEEITNATANQNKCYYIVATKKELKEKGILGKSNLFKKAKIDPSAIDKTLFTIVDKREFHNLIIQSKKAEILTPIPAESYTIEKEDKNTCKLQISDVNKFWSITNILIIQTN